MGTVVVSTATAQCSFGLAPAVLNVTSQVKCMCGNMPAATIQDCQLANMTFGMCNSLANPTVASATAAALGVLTPMPCTLVPAGTWIPAKPTVLVNNKPVLTSDSTLMCAYAGVIKVNVPGQFKVNA